MTDSPPAPLAPCSCPKRCPDLETMRREHGTPAEYADALERAVCGLMITPYEATAAAVKYASEYARASGVTALAYTIEECIEHLDLVSRTHGPAADIERSCLHHLRAAQANEAFLRRIVTYVTEDRAVTPGATRLARCVEQVRSALGPLKEPKI